MVGYSRLVAADEPGTLERHRVYCRDLIDPRLTAHGGRLVKTSGDGFLAEFSSVAAAVQCAAEIQVAVAGHERNSLPDRRIHYRIGVNLGDVVVDGSDILGDGVNVAARLEQLCEPGGVYVSGAVFQSARSNPDLHFEDLGYRSIKNLPDPVRVYRLQLKVAGPAASRLVRIRDAPQLPAKPSIAVLPFTNMSELREQDHFADGMTEELITALSRIRELFVISRHSSFFYKGRTVRLEDVAREVGVRFLLEGSVRVAGSKVRVTAQLIDGLSGAHVWAERYDGPLDDIFSVQDEITRSIAVALQVKLTYGETARLWEGQTQNLRAWERMVLARDLFLKYTPSDSQNARRILEEALVIDPHYTGAMVQLGLVHWIDARFGFFPDRERSLRLAEEQVEAALRINPDLGGAHMVRGGIAFLRDQHDEAVVLCRHATQLAPGDSWVQAFFGLVCNYCGEASTAVGALTTAMRLSPHYPMWCLYNLALGHLWAGDLASAQDAAERHLEREPDDPYSYTILATVYGFQDRLDDAAFVVRRMRERLPTFDLAQFLPSQRYKERERLERVEGVLRRAGLPD